MEHFTQNARPHPRGPAAQFVTRLLATSAFLALCLLTCAKGTTGTFHTDELYFWVNTYAHGFVRRGLAGSLTAPWLSNVTASGVHMVAIDWWLVGLTSTLILSAVIFWRGMTSPNAAATCSVGALVATSPMLGLVTYHVGYPDTLIAGLVAANAALLPSASAMVLAAGMILASAFHEMAFLQLLPVLVFAACLREFARTPTVILTAAGLAAGLLPFLGVQPADDTLQHLVATGMTLPDATESMETALHQTISGSVGRMYGVWSTHFFNGLLGVVYAGVPGGVIMLVGWPAAAARVATRFPAGAQRALLMASYAAACLGPIALLALAWDLTRIVSFTTLTAAMTVALVGRQQQLRAGKTIAVVSCLVATVYLCMPIMNMYFDYGRALNTAPMARICSPCAHAGIAATDFFNRGLTQKARLTIETDPRYGDADRPQP